MISSCFRNKCTRCWRSPCLTALMWLFKWKCSNDKWREAVIGPWGRVNRNTFQNVRLDYVNSTSDLSVSTSTPSSFPNHPYPPPPSFIQHIRRGLHYSLEETHIHVSLLLKAKCWFYYHYIMMQIVFISIDLLWLYVNLNALHYK